MANEERCHYFGHLANEPEACVAMTGCVGSEDVEFMILSAHSHGSHILKWTKEGNVEILEYKGDGNSSSIDYVEYDDDDEGFSGNSSSIDYIDPHDDDEDFSEAADFDDRALPALPKTQLL